MFRNVYERNKEKFPYSRFEVLVRLGLGLGLG